MKVIIIKTDKISYDEMSQDVSSYFMGKGFYASGNVLRGKGLEIRLKKTRSFLLIMASIDDALYSPIHDAEAIQRATNVLSGGLFAPFTERPPIHIGADEMPF